MSCGNEPIARWQARFRLPAVPFRYNRCPDDSPVAGIWTKYSCKTCLYAWRSTEPEENTNPDKSGAVPGEAGGLGEISGRAGDPAAAMGLKSSCLPAFS
jgi:hypothetical protein